MKKPTRFLQGAACMICHHWAEKTSRAKYGGWSFSCRFKTAQSKRTITWQYYFLVIREKHIYYYYYYCIPFLPIADPLNAKSCQLPRICRYLTGKMGFPWKKKVKGHIAKWVHPPESDKMTLHKISFWCSLRGLDHRTILEIHPN